MPYIGKTELKSSDVVADSFTGNGSTTAFTLSKVPPSEQAVLVSINGVKQHTDAYSISGTTLTLSAAPDTGDAIEAVSIIDIGEAAGDSLPTQTGNSGKFLTTDGTDSSWGDISLGDNVKAQFGAGNDLQIYHSGSHSYINEAGQGSLYISGSTGVTIRRNDTSAEMATFDTGVAKLYWDGSEKLATTSTGIDVTGSVRADSFSGGSTTRSITISESNGNDSAIIYASSGDKLELRANSNTYNQVVLAEDGNVGISETSADRKLHVNSGTSNVVAKFESTDSVAAIEFTDSAGSAEIGCVGNDVAFFPAGVEKARIDSSGNVLVGKTSSNLASVGIELHNSDSVRVTRSGDTPVYLNRLSSDGNLIDFRKDGTTVGNISTWDGEIAIGRINCALLFDDDANKIKPHSVANNTIRDNALDLGHSNARFDDIYATNGTIQTSDRNEKQDIEELSDAEQRVAVACKGLLRKFRWIDKVEAKGDDARIHFGIIAQDLQDAFVAEGLDAGRYAMFISSTWTDEETGEERTRLGVRYPELLAFIIASL